MQRNYYCVIPSNVMDDDRLTPNAKLMYGLISSLTNQKGYCYANNQFFQDYFKKNKNTIIGWLNQLKEANHIQIEFDPKNANKRAIKLDLRGSKNRDKGFKKLNQRVQKNAPPILYTYSNDIDTNINNINNINNNTNIKKEKVEKEKSFSAQYLKAYDHIVLLFAPSLQPKDEAQKRKWLEVICELDVLRGVSARLTYFLCKKVLEDTFWKKTFQSVLKLTRENKDGVMYYKYFLNVYRDEIYKSFNSEELKRIK